MINKKESMILNHALADPRRLAAERPMKPPLGKILPAYFMFSAGAAAWMSIDEPAMARAAFLSTAALALWLTELAPLYVPTLLLLAGIPLLLGGTQADFSLGAVLSWPAQPVMALFFGGFALGAAGQKHGIDSFIARATADLADGSRPRLLFAVMGATAVMSMWMSNAAAAAMMVAALRPLWKDLPAGDPFRRALLLGVAFGADFGGMATPVGTGPNALALAAAGISFLDWILLAAPLAGGILLAVFFLLKRVYRVSGSFIHSHGRLSRPSSGAWMVAAVFGAAVLLWLSEPWHGLSPGLTALCAAAALFAFRLLDAGDLARLDWSTLLLIAGGLTLGELVERSGLARAAAAQVNWGSLPPAATVGIIVFSAAALSSVASNTAAAALIMPLAAGVMASPSTPVLVAVGASLGAPFIISTPPNVLVYGQGGLKSRDFLVPGLFVMLAGTAVVSLTGPIVLRWLGSG